MEPIIEMTLENSAVSSVPEQLGVKTVCCAPAEAGSSRSKRSGHNFLIIPDNLPRDRPGVCAVGVLNLEALARITEADGRKRNPAHSFTLRRDEDLLTGHLQP